MPQLFANTAPLRAVILERRARGSVGIDCARLCTRQISSPRLAPSVVTERCPEIFSDFFAEKNLFVFWWVYQDSNLGPAD
jgi:hypothetical protein